MIIRPFIVCVASLYAATVLADAPPDFSGQWIADEHNADSDAPAKSDTTPGSHSGGGHGGGMGGGSHGMGGGGGGHHGGGRNTPNANGSATTTAMPGNDPRVHAHTLIIRQSDSVFDVAADGQRTAYRFDNRNNYGAQYGGTVTLKWLAPEMSVETHPDTGGTVIEHYTLSDDGKHMALEIRTEQADGSAREMRREFHLDDGSAAQTLP